MNTQKKEDYEAINAYAANYNKSENRSKAYGLVARFALAGMLIVGVGKGTAALTDLTNPSDTVPVKQALKK